MRYPSLSPVEAYLARYPKESDLSLLRRQLKAQGDIFSRKNMTGHITASGLILNEEASQTLLIQHRGLDKWLQSGGHIDPGDGSIWQAAEREINEETGLTRIALHPWHAENAGMPVHVDTHPIPARPERQEGAHDHHDCLYVFVTAETEVAAGDDGVAGTKWRAIADPCVPARLKHALNRLQGARL